MRRKRAAVTGVVSSLLKHISASLSLGRSEGAGALLSKQQRREQRKAQSARCFFFQRMNDARMDGKSEKRESERHLSSPPSSSASSLSHLLDLRQAEAERRVDPREELVASHEVGAVRGRGHREMEFFSFVVVVCRRRRRRSRRMGKSAAVSALQSVLESSSPASEGERGDGVREPQAQREKRSGKRAAEARTRTLGKKGGEGKSKSEENEEEREKFFFFFFLSFDLDGAHKHRPKERKKKRKTWPESTPPSSSSSSPC